MYCNYGPKICPAVCWIVFLLLPLGLGGCSKQEFPAVPTIRLGHALHDHHAPLFIAATLPDIDTSGTYRLREIEKKRQYQLLRGTTVLANVTIQSSTGGMELIRKLYEDQFDLAFGGVPAILKAVDEGHGIKIIAPSNAEGAGLVVHKDIPAGNFAEFVNFVQTQKAPVRIGYKTGTSVQNLIFESSLKHLNIPYSFNIDDPMAKVVLVNVHGPANLMPSLEAGVIDGFVINQPFVALAEYTGTGKRIANLSSLPPAGRWEGNPCCAIAATNTVIAAYPEAITALTSLFLKANQFIQNNQETASIYIANWLGKDPAVERLSLPTIRFTTELSGHWERGVNIWIESMLTSNALHGTIREKHSDPEGLKQHLYATQIYQQAIKNL